MKLRIESYIINTIARPSTPPPRTDDNPAKKILNQNSFSLVNVIIVIKVNVLTIKGPPKIWSW